MEVEVRTLAEDLSRILRSRPSPHVVATLFNSSAITRLLLSHQPCESKMLLSRLHMLQNSASMEAIVLWYKGNQAQRYSIARTVVTHCRKQLLLNVTVHNTKEAGKPLRFGLNSNFNDCMTACVLRNDEETATKARSYVLGHGIREVTKDNLESEVAVPGYTIFYEIPAKEFPELHQISLSELECVSKQKWSNLLSWAFLNSKFNGKIRAYFPRVEARPVSASLVNTMVSGGLIIPQTISPWFLLSLEKQVHAILSRFISYTCDELHSSLLYAVMAEIFQSPVGSGLVASIHNSYLTQLIDLLQDMGIVLVDSNNPNIIHTTPLSRILTMNSSSFNRQDQFALSQAYSTNLSSSNTSPTASLLLSSVQYNPHAIPQNYSDHIAMTYPYRRISDPLSTLPQSEHWYRYMQRTGKATGSVKPHSLTPVDLHGSGLITESNFRVYLLHPDVLQASMLETFAEISINSPQALVAMIRRDSVMTAFENGMTSQNILDFLRSHTSKHVTDHLIKGDTDQGGTELDFYNIGGNIIPENVVNQIILWEKQRSSINIEPCTVIEFNQANEIEIYPLLINRLSGVEGLLYHTPLPKGLVTNVGEEFDNWKEDIKERLQLPENYMLFGAFKNHYPRYPMIAIASALKNNVLKLIKELKSVSNITKKIPSSPPLGQS